MPGNYRFMSVEQKQLVLTMHEVEDGGAIRTESRLSRGLASPAPACFLKRLFVQSEAESRNFREVPRVLHLAVIVLRGCCVQGSGSKSNHRKCFEKSRKMAKKSGKYMFKKGIVLTTVMLFYGFV